MKNNPVLERFSDNPILEPVPSHWWESKAVFNPGAIYLDGKVHIVYRAIGDANRSVLGYAASSDGFHIDERQDRPSYSPRELFEGGSIVYPEVSSIQEPMISAGGDEKSEDVDYTSGGGVWGGCEDPRLTVIEDTVYMTYVAYDGHNPPRVALTSIKAPDFLARNWQWKKPVLISLPDVVDKNACILPEKINSKFVIFHRIYPEILIDFVDNLDFDGKTNWLKGEFRILPREDYWDSRKLGAGAPPLRTKEGWLLVYQAVGENDPIRYKIGAMLLDIKDPTRVLARSEEPLLEPYAKYENEGWKAGVVYPCGAVIKNERLYVYYGGADKFVCAASLQLDELLNYMVGARKTSGLGTDETQPVKLKPKLMIKEKKLPFFAFCFNCRVSREIKNPRQTILKNGRRALQGKCQKCGTKMFRIMKD